MVCVLVVAEIQTLKSYEESNFQTHCYLSKSATLVKSTHKIAHFI